MEERQAARFPRAVTSLDRWQRLNPREREIAKPAAQAVSRARRKGWTISLILRDSDLSIKGLTLEQIKRFAGPALRKDDRGRWVPKSGDALIRELQVISDGQLRPVLVQGDRRARALSQYARAIYLFVKRGDSTELEKFRRRWFKSATGEGIRFEVRLE